MVDFTKQQLQTLSKEQRQSIQEQEAKNQAVYEQQLAEYNRKVAEREQAQADYEKQVAYFNKQDEEYRIARQIIEGTINPLAYQRTSVMDKVLELRKAGFETDYQRVRREFYEGAMSTPEGKVVYQVIDDDFNKPKPQEPKPPLEPFYIDSPFYQPMSYLPKNQETKKITDIPSLLTQYAGKGLLYLGDVLEPAVTKTVGFVTKQTLGSGVSEAVTKSLSSTPLTKKEAEILVGSIAVSGFFSPSFSSGTAQKSVVKTTDKRQIDEIIDMLRSDIKDAGGGVKKIKGFSERIEEVNKIREAGRLAGRTETEINTLINRIYGKELGNKLIKATTEEFPAFVSSSSSGGGIVTSGQPIIIESSPVKPKVIVDFITTQSPNAKFDVVSPLGISTGLGIKSEVSTSSIQRQYIDFKPLLTTKSENTLKIKTEERLSNKQITTPELRVNTLQNSALSSKTLQISEGLLRTEQITKQQLRTEQIIRQTPKTRTPTINTPKIPTKPLITSSPSKKISLLKSALSKVQAYDVYTYKGGKKIKVFEGLPKGLALKKGSELVRSTLRASFKLEPKGTTETKDINFRLPKEVFTTSKRDKERIVQRRKFRLSARSEVSEIMSAKKRSKRRFKLI